MCHSVSPGRLCLFESGFLAKFDFGEHVSIHRQQFIETKALLHVSCVKIQQQGKQGQFLKKRKTNIYVRLKVGFFRNLILENMFRFKNNDSLKPKLCCSAKQINDSADGSC